MHHCIPCSSGGDKQGTPRFAASQGSKGSREVLIVHVHHELAATNSLASCNKVSVCVLVRQLCTYSVLGLGPPLASGKAMSCLSQSSACDWLPLSSSPIVHPPSAATTITYSIIGSRKSLSPCLRPCSSLTPLLFHLPTAALISR